MSYISLKGVSYSYPLGEGRSLKALKNLSISVESGEYVALVGMNGSGKSTFAKLLNGLFLPTLGDVEIDGMNTKDEKKIFEIRKTAGMVFQNPDNQTVATIVEDDVAFGPENLGVSRDEIGRRIEWALDAVNMTEYRRAAVSKLSGGQKQRVAIAGVLAMKPKILILDESTSMLDPTGRAEIMAIAKKLNDDGITVFNITHNMDEAAQADRIIALNRGTVAIDGTPREVFASPRLAECGLALPPAARVENELSNAGFSFDDISLNLNELVEGVWKQLN